MSPACQSRVAGVHKGIPQRENAGIAIARPAPKGSEARQKNRSKPLASGQKALPRRPVRPELQNAARARTSYQPLALGRNWGLRHVKSGMRRRKKTITGPRTLLPFGPAVRDWRYSTQAERPTHYRKSALRSPFEIGDIDMNKLRGVVMRPLHIFHQPPFRRGPGTKRCHGVQPDRREREWRTANSESIKSDARSRYRTEVVRASRTGKNQGHPLLHRPEVDVIAFLAGGGVGLGYGAA